MLFGFSINNFQVLKAQEKQYEKLKNINLKRQDLHFLKTLDTGDGITKEQFVLALLVHLGTVDANKDVKPWLEVSWLLFVSMNCIITWHDKWIRFVFVLQKFEELDKARDGILRRDVSWILFL